LHDLLRIILPQKISRYLSTAVGQQALIDRVPMEVRALDTKELADALCSYAQEEAPAERVAGNAA